MPQVTEIPDLIQTTLADYERDNFVNWAMPLQQYPAAEMLVNKHRMRIDGGTSHKWKVLTGTNGSARVNPVIGGVDSSGTSNNWVEATMDWKSMTWNYAIDDFEVDINGIEPEKIIDIVEARKIEADLDGVKLIESQFWGKPTGTSDTETWNGVKYWFPFVASSAGDFVGGAPSGFTTVAGLTPGDYTRHNNYCRTYTTANYSDLCRKVDEAMYKCDFKSPRRIAEIVSECQFGFYMNYAVKSSLEDQARNNNDQLGNDLLSYAGRTMLKRIDMEVVSSLDTYSTALPFYGISWNSFKLVVAGKWWMKTSKVIRAPKQHTVSEVHTDTKGNFCCYDRSRNFVLATTTF